MVKSFGISRGVSPRETFGQVAEIAKQTEELGFETCCGSSIISSG